MSIIHARNVFNFLDVLGNVGSVQLVFTLLFIYILASGPESMALMNTMKKFFIIKTSDSNLLEHGHDEDQHYYFKLNDNLKNHFTLMNSILCSCLPNITKKQKKLHKIMEQGEEKMNEYITAEHIFKVLE